MFERFKRYLLHGTIPDDGQWHDVDLHFARSVTATESGEILTRRAMVKREGDKYSYAPSPTLWEEIQGDAW